MEIVKQLLPTFQPHKDIALVMLTKGQLESLKADIARGIIAGTIEYGKDAGKPGEVYAYARSMVMNWLKKGKELNGNQIYGVGPAVAQSKQLKTTASLNRDILPDDLRAFVDTLV